jgi:hypothetical protein
MGFEKPEPLWLFGWKNQCDIGGYIAATKCKFGEEF